MLFLPIISESSSLFVYDSLYKKKSHLSRSVLIVPVSVFCTDSPSQIKSCTLWFLQLFQLSVKEYTVLNCMSGLVWNLVFWWENIQNGFMQILAYSSFKIVTNPSLIKMTQASWGFSNLILRLVMPNVRCSCSLAISIAWLYQSF